MKYLIALIKDYMWLQTAQQTAVSLNVDIQVVLDQINSGVCRYHLDQWLTLGAVKQLLLAP